MCSNTPSGGVYAARRDLLALTGPTVVPGIPAGYRFDGAPRLQGPHGLLTMIAHQVRGLGSDTHGEIVIMERYVCRWRDSYLLRQS